ncbi:choice-of-anchor D domain-containing protein [Psychroserpens ponticola]|uniref:Choice-of-anchor D domain-containing protein n=1 Tax=Psychroserpens ponticola TaxID=2932268 RepID=A0ABY7RUE2_9FLAO|nr:choice-of-anchor D domain-containing protein [Psychroserpens ponticola]WCO00588.1 choice-of-anchor D domain-containing protein [Psychroserpens ponticola]
MKFFTLSLRAYAIICCVLLFSKFALSQTPDYKVQHLEDNIARSGGSNTSFTPVSSLNNAVELANNNRKSNAGQSGSAANLDGDDLAGARQLTNTGTLTYYREGSSLNSNMRFNTSLWEYIGAPGGNNEMIVRGRYAVNLNGTNNSITQALSGISNANDCIPFITGIMNDTTNDDADSGTAIAYLENATTLRVRKGSNDNDVTVYITVVEFTGSNWTVLHGDSGNSSNDTGTFTINNNSDGTGTVTNVSSWNDAIIFSHHIGDTGASGDNDAIADNWPVMEPGSSNNTVDWTFNGNHDSAGTNRHFVHVLTNSGLNVTRFQNTSNSANETTINITSAGLSDVNQALIVGSSISSGGGSAYGRGWRNYYFNSATQAAHWAHRSGNTMAHEIQIVDLSGLNTIIAGPEINITGNSNTINDGDTTPTLTDDTDFGNVNASAGNHVNTFTIQNIGTTSLSVNTTINISGTHASDFTVTATPSASVAASGTTTFDITFNPSAVGLRTASVSIINGDSDENPYNFDIEGTGTVLTYCTSSGTNSDSYTDNIRFVDFNTINNSSPNADIGYSDYTGISTTITQGSTYDLTVNVNTTGGYTYHVTAWIDWNQNGDFTDGGESYDLGSAYNTANGPPTGSPLSITVPGTSTLGTTRMRITTKWASDATSCETGFDGEVEDYTLEIITATPAPEINIQGNATTIADGDTTPNFSDDTDFGNIDVAAGTKVNTFTIENTGTSSLSVGTINISGTNASDFTVTSSPSASVAAYGSTTFDITFNPSAIGLRTASVSIINDDSDENPYSFDIEGTGTVTTYSNVTVSVDWPSYANENTVEIYSPSGTLINTINSGGASPFDTILNLGCLEDLTNYYIIMYDSWDDGWQGPDNITVTAGGTEVINQDGDSATSGGVTVYFDVSGGGSNEIEITGNGNTINDGDITPIVTDDTDFGNVNVSGGTDANTFTINNVGCSDLNLTGSSPYITIAGTHAADFTITTIPSALITSGNSTTFEITFNPSAIGLRTASISIANDDSDENPYNFNIHGNGFTPGPEINITGNSNSINDGDTTPSLTDDTDFGNVAIAAGTNVNTFTIQNTGTASLSVGTITISGANAADFTVTSSPSSSVAASGSTSFDITFNPSAIGIKTASVSIVNDDSDENPYNFDIQGTGTVPAFSNVSVSVNWPSYAYENRVEIYTPTGTLINSIGYGGTASHSETINLGCLEDLNNYYFIMYDTWNDGWQGADNITITSGGSIVINQDGNSATTGGVTTYFDVSGGGGDNEIEITGNGTTISDGDTTPSIFDNSDFGNVDVASGTNANTFTINNFGCSDLNLTAASPYITISGANAADFSITSIPSSLVSSGNSTTFEITFNPSAIGLRTASVTIANDDSDENPYNFNIHGNGASATYSNVTVSVSWPSYAYENRVEIYTPSGVLIDSYGYVAPFSDATLLDLGCLEDLNNYYFIMYDNANDGWDGTDNITITAGGSTVINQDGDSATSGGVTTYFNVSGGGGGNEIEITGNGITITDGDTTPATLDDTDFGSIDITAGTNAHTFTINNIGCIGLNLTAASPYITISGAHAGDFSITNIPSPSIASGNSTTFEITFNPSAIGLRTASLSIANDDSDENPYNFNIQGTGFTAAPEINITGNGNTINDGDIFPSTTDDTEFPAVSVTGATHTKTYTIENTGAATLNIGTITISGLHAGDFSVTASPSSSVAAFGSTTFNITFDPSVVGLRTANIIVANNDSDESTYYFSIQGYGITPGACTVTVSSFPYEESFESGFGLWTQGVNAIDDDFNWSRTTSSTPSGSTGPNAAPDGNYYSFTEANGNNNSTTLLNSPCFDLTSASNPKFTFSYHMYGSGMGDLFVELSTDNGINYPNILYTNSGEIHANSNSSFTPISIDLSSYIGQTVRIRFRGEVAGSNSSDMAIDLLTLEDKPTPTVAPGGVTADLGLWLKTDVGLSYTSGQDVTDWVDQGLGSDAKVNHSNQAPTYYDNTSKNVNFNPVIEFDNSYTALNIDSDYSHDSTNTEFLSGDYGFYTQEVFIVLIPDNTPINTSFGFMDVFCSDSQLEVQATDATGIGFGNYTGRVNNEIICYAHDSYDNSYGDGYAVAEIGTGSSYNNVGIINTRNNPAVTQQELFYNANDIGTTQNDIAEFMNTNDSRWWLGRSEGWEASLNARVAEVITYSTRKDDANLTQERNRIQSYLGIKYGITLGVNGTSQDYVNSDGTVIWDQSADSGNYNYDIAGIGRDDASGLNQKQSRSVNNALDGGFRSEGVLTMGLSDIYTTNNINKASNPTELGDKEFLVWGNNGADLDLAASVISVNMSAGISPALSTDVSFTAMRRIWKVEENGGDVPTMKVRIPQNAIRNITPPGNFYMFISSTGVFDPTADYRVMTDDGNGNLETEYDFDNTKYITFGYAPQVIVERSIYFDGVVDYVDMEDALDLNPDEFTISAWIKRDATDTGSKSILSKRNTAFTQGYDFKVLGNNRLQIYWKNGSNQYLNSTTLIPNEEWHHVAATYDGTTVSLYIDGVLETSAARTPPVATDESFYIAAGGKGTPTQHFKGNIDEVRVWDKLLSQEQLRFIMNQEIEDNSSIVAGKVLPNSISKNDVETIPWNDLAGYYPMSVYTYTNTEDASGNSNQGALRNLNTVDRQTAPLPYESTQNGDWDLQSTWANGSVQTIPGTTSIVDSNQTVDWNIIRTNHNITINDDSDLPASKNGNRTVLGLMVDSNELEVSGVTDATTNSGYGLTVSHFLDLTGTIDLEGESQLIQTADSDLVVASSGRLERDQQGTADTFTYNYWSSPVGQTDMETNEFRYNLTNVMQNVGFQTTGYNGTTSPLRIADYWVWTFSNLADGDYSAWQQTRSTGAILAGEGFTMKGPGSGALTDDQNYIFRGKPNNGHIDLTINAGNNYLVGNPYASAIDAVEFINDNLGVTTGTLYFWEHWGGGNHVLQDYQGGYALMNLSGGTPSVTLGQPVSGISNTGTARKTPGRYIPVSQGFFVVADAGGQIKFENDQRQFQKEDGTLNGNSVFVRNSEATASAYQTESTSGDPRMKFRIGVYTVNTIQRQLLLTIDPNATTAVDLGYDGILNEVQMDDMFWMIDGDKYIIQGSNDVEIDTTYPLGIKTDSEGINTISINSLENVPDSLDIFIHDIENNIYHNLRDSDYEIFLNAGEYLDRFEVTFRDAEDTLEIEDNELSSLEVYYSNDIESLVLLNPNFKHVKSIELFNIVGQSIHTIKDISELDYSEYEVKNLSSGTYIVKINTGSGSVSKKVLVK